MSRSDSDLPAQWQYYSTRAAEAQRSRCDPYGLGREEQLDEILATIERNDPFDDACRTRLDRLTLNRSQKHRRMLDRLHLEHRFQKRVVRDVSLDVAEKAASVMRLMAIHELRVEQRLADGYTFEEISSELQVASGTLRVSVSRTRTRVRNQLGLSA